MEKRLALAKGCVVWVCNYKEAAWSFVGGVVRTTLCPNSGGKYTDLHMYYNFKNYTPEISVLLYSFYLSVYSIYPWMVSENFFSESSISDSFYRYS